MKKPKRWNKKRPCWFCKVAFASQRIYNKHVNRCPERTSKT